MLNVMVLDLKSPHSFHMNLRGLTQVYTSQHKCFFSEAMGYAMRSASQGTPSLIFQFLKGGIAQGVDHPINLTQDLQWYRSDISRALSEGDLISNSEKEAVLDLWTHACKLINTGNYRLVILDELSLAIKLSLVNEQEVLNLIEKRPHYIDLIFTGTHMPTALLDMADQITNVKARAL